MDNDWPMRLLRLSILLATIILVPAGAAATVADIVANVANLLQQAINSQRSPIAALDGRIYRLRNEPTTSPLASGRTQLRWSRDQAVMAEPMPRAKSRTCLQSRQENKDGCIMTSQRDPDPALSAPLI